LPDIEKVIEKTVSELQGPVMPVNNPIEPMAPRVSARGHDGYDMRTLKKIEGTSSYPKKKYIFFFKFTIGLRMN
jgi:hypothetical protein